MNDLKRCTKCGEEKPRAEFWRETRRLDGLYCWCKGCGMAAKNSHREENHERLTAQAKRYRKNNHGRVRAIEIRYQKNNREKLNARRKCYREKNYEKIQASKRQSREKIRKNDPCVYCAKVAEGRVKIGMTVELVVRIKKLQNVIGVPFAEVHFMPMGTKREAVEYERSLHCRLHAHRREYGEWFDPHPDVLGLVNEVGWKAATEAQE